MSKCKNHEPEVLIRGTTPSIPLYCAVDVDEMDTLYVTFSQRGKTIIEKTLDDVTYEDDNIVIVDLTQEETLALTADVTLKIQLRCKDVSDNAYASEIIETTVTDVLKTGEI